MVEKAKIPNSILKELENQHVVGGKEDSAQAIARLFNPTGIEDYYLLSKDGDKISCFYREGSGYKVGTVSLSEIEKEPVVVDVYFKKKKISELLFKMSNNKLEKGGHPSSEDTKPLNYAGYVSAVSKAISDDSGGDEAAVNVIIDSNIELVNSCFKEGMPYQYCAKRLTGKEAKELNSDILNIYFYKPDTDELSNRSEWFSEEAERSLTVLRVKESLTRNHEYEEIAEISFSNPVAIDAHAAKKIIKDLFQKTESDADNKMCIAVFNYDKPDKNFKILLFAKKYLTTKYALMLKSIIHSSLKWLGINIKDSEIKCSIKQPA